MTQALYAHMNKKNKDPISNYERKIYVTRKNKKIYRAREQIDSCQT
jgi:hypothetical protein